MRARQMKLSSLFLLTVSTCFLQGCNADEPQESHDIISNLTLEWRETNLQASWTLLIPSGHLGYYSVTWDDGVQTRSRTQTMQELTMGSNFPCSHVLKVTVAPHNETGWAIGEPASRSYIWQDILKNITLKKNGNVTLAHWSVECRSKVYLKFKMTCQENGKSQSSLRTSYDSASRGQTKFSGLCSNDRVSLCTSFYISIQQITGVPSNNISASGLYSSFELHFELLSPGSIRLTWPSPSRVCAITRYIVHYSGTQLWGNRSTHTDWFPKEEQVYNRTNLNQRDDHVDDRREVVLTNLWPFSDYVVSVTAERSKNESLKSIVLLQTPESKPSAPASITATPIASNIVANWSKPMRMNGNLISYVLRWYTNFKRIGTHKSTNQSYTISNLEPCENYIITISAITGGGEGEAAQTRRMVGNDCSRRRLNTTITTSTSNSNPRSEQHTTEGFSPPPIPEPTCRSDWTWYALLAAVCSCLVIISALVIIPALDRRRRPGERRRRGIYTVCNRFGKMCCNSKEENDGEIASPSEQDANEMNAFR